MTQHSRSHTHWQGQYTQPYTKQCLRSYAIDKANGNRKWRQALDDEIKRHGNQLSAIKWQSLAETINAKNEQDDEELQKQEGANVNTITINDYEDKLSNTSLSI